MKNFIILSVLSNKITICFIAIIILLISGCKSTQNNLNCKDIKRIKIAYLPKDILTYLPVDIPEEIVMYEQTEYITVTDKNFICSLTERINKLEKSNKKVLYDFKVIAYLYAESDTIPLKLYLGNQFIIVYNDNLMKYDKELFKLFDDLLYKNSEDILDE